MRVADEVLTILAEAALENEQIDKAMEAMGIAQNLKKKENVVVARGGGPKSVHTGLGQAARHGLCAENSKTKVRYLGSWLTWKMSFSTERETRIAGLERVAHDGSVLESAGGLQAQVQHLQGNRARCASLSKGIGTHFFGARPCCDHMLR